MSYYYYPVICSLSTSYNMVRRRLVTVDIFSPVSMPPCPASNIEVRPGLQNVSNDFRLEKMLELLHPSVCFNYDFL